MESRTDDARHLLDDPYAPVAPAESGDHSSGLPPLNLVVACLTCPGGRIVALGRMCDSADFRSVIYPSQSPRSVSTLRPLFYNIRGQSVLTKRLTTVPRVLGSEADIDPDLRRFAAVPPVFFHVWSYQRPLFLSFPPMICSHY